MGDLVQRDGVGGRGERDHLPAGRDELAHRRHHVRRCVRWAGAASCPSTPASTAGPAGRRSSSRAPDRPSPCRARCARCCRCSAGCRRPRPGRDGSPSPPASATVARAGRSNSATMRVRHAQLGDRTAHLVAAGEHRHATQQPVGRPAADALPVHQCHRGHAPGVERPLDHEVALGHEQPVAAVVAALQPVREAALVEPERSDPGSSGSSMTISIRSARGRGSSRGRASRGTTCVPPAPRRWRRRAGWPRRRTPAGRPARRR